MLQDLRDKSQGWIAWIIIGLIALTFVLLGAFSFTGAGGADQVAAKVNGKKITVDELNIAYDNILQQAGNEALRSLDQNAVKKDILDTLIEQTLITQQAERMGMRVSPQYINTTIETLPFLQKNNRFSPELYHRFLSSFKYTDSSFRQLLKEDLLRNQLQDGISRSAFATQADVEEAIALIQQKRQFRVSRFLRDNYNQDIHPSQEEIASYYQAHLEDYKTEEQIKLAYIELKLSDFSNKINVDEATVEAYYKSHQDEFTDPEKFKIAHILVALSEDADEAAQTQARNKIDAVQEKLKNGQSFSDLASTDSDDKASASQGGELSWFSKGEMIPEIEKATINLQPGDTSDVIKTRFGYHILKLIDRHDKKVRPYPSVKQEIEEQLKTQIAEEQYLNAVDTLNDLAYDSPDALEPVADKLDMTLQTSELFNMKEGPADKTLQSPSVLAAAFSPSVLVEKMNSELIKVDDNHYVVLRAIEYVPTLQKPLNDVYSEVEKQLIFQHSSDLAKRAALQAESSILGTKVTVMPEVMDQYTWETVEKISRYDNAVNADILNAAFSLPDDFHKSDKIMKVTEYGDGDYALVWLLAIENGDPKEISDKEKKSYQQALSHRFGELDAVLFVKGLTNVAKIKNKLVPNQDA